MTIIRFTLAERTSRLNEVDESVKAAMSDAISPICFPRTDGTISLVLRFEAYAKPI
jgi:hypothetical protein